MPSSESARSSEEETTERSSMLPSTNQQSKTLQWQDNTEEWDEELELSEDEEIRADRRIYGGKHEHGRTETGDRSVTQVSMDVALTVLSGTPLIIPAAIQATGLTVGIPLLFLVAFLSWVAHVVLNVERRYVGGFNIAKAVFPSGYGGSYIGQILIDLLILVAATLRTVITLSLSLHLLSQCLEAMFPDTPYLHAYRWLAAILTLIYIMAFTLPPPLAFLASPFWALLRSYSWPLYLISLLIVCLRARSIEQIPTAPIPLWSGINLILFSLCTQQSTFRLLSTLRQTSTSIKNDLTISIKRNQLQRYGWETASFIGLAISSIVLLLFGLFLPNMEALPIQDGWLLFARLLLLTTILSSLPITIKPSSSALRRLLLLLLGICGVEEPDALAQSQNGGRVSNWFILDKAVMGVTVVICGVISGVFGQELDGIAQIGAVVSNLLCLLVPATFFIVLFHVRKARAIFVSDPSALSGNDELLLRKEQQLQRRLSGRRISQDLVVFGGILPFSLAVLIKTFVSRTF